MAETPGPAAKVLVVEDEPILAGTIANYLQRAGYLTRIEGDGIAAVTAVRDWQPQVVVLDLNLPGIDGIEVCRRVRTFSDCYVLMLTARDAETDELTGLSAGADDYVTKPFSARSLVARIGVLLRRPIPDRHPEERTFGGLRIAPGTREAFVAGVPVHLTRTEFDVLAALSDRPGTAWSREDLSRAVWGPDWVGHGHLVDTHVAHIRQKLGDDPARPRFVLTVRGIGYRIGPGQ